MRNYFYFNQREKQGIIVLLALIISIFSLSFFIKEKDPRPISKEEKARIKKWIDQHYTKPTNTNTSLSQQKKSQKRFRKLNIQLNSTDSAELTKIRGIGPSFSRRIIKYRKLLGGYFSSKQLLEIYGLDSIKYDQIKEHFVLCDTTKLHRLDLNSATFKQLLKHPYISYDFVKRIVNAGRKEKYKSILDLKTRGVIPDSLYQKIRPYIKVED